MKSWNFYTNLIFRSLQLADNQSQTGNNELWNSTREYIHYWRKHFHTTLLSPKPFKNLSRAPLSHSPKPAPLQTPRDAALYRARAVELFAGELTHMSNARVSLIWIAAAVLIGALFLARWGVFLKAEWDKYLTESK